MSGVYEVLDVLDVIAREHAKVYQSVRANDAMREARATVAALIQALVTITESEEYDGDTVVCDFRTLQGVAATALLRARRGA